MKNQTLLEIEMLLRTLNFTQTDIEEVYSFEHEKPVAEIFIPKDPLPRHKDIVLTFLIDNGILTEDEARKAFTNVNRGN